MASSSSIAKNKNPNNICKCRLPAIIFTSKTPNNSGCRFWRCRNWTSEGQDCHHFAWVREADEKICGEDIHEDSVSNNEKKLVAKLIFTIEELKQEKKGTQHQFNARESDWGFKTFMPLSDLYDPGRGYIVNDSCTVKAEVAVREVIGYWNCDSKEETGCVGLQNEGATCYMNSLLQTLYHIPFFRKAVYHMPTTEDDLPSGSIPLTLQSLFSKLQHSDSSVATKELTKSLGWDMDDSFIQHDVQELNRVLCQKLEDKMKGTVVEGTIQLLFEGHHMNYIQSINVDYKPTRKELFYDLQLDVKGCQDVYASFDKYCEGEWLEGDKKYHAEHHGLQDARKGVLFIDLPPVLQLHLKRFEYDFTGDTMVKINDRYEFPLHLDLDRDNRKYLSPDADRSVRNLYTLHSILVHSGEVHGGRYYAFIRPTLSDQWLKFDDERVTKEDAKKALEEHYGGKEELPQTNPSFNKTPKFMKHANAYMLVYIRESDKDKIISNVDKKDIVEHLRIRLKKEQKEEEHKKEKAEAHPYTIIKVVRDDDLREQIGRDVYFDLVDHEKVRSFHIQKQLPFHMFKEKVAKEFGIPVQFQRFWLWARRENHTFRPQRSLTPQEEAQFVGQLREERSKLHIAELRLFLEVELGQNLRPVPPPDMTNEDILLFFKLYDPEEEELRYVGRLFVKALGKPSDILLKLNEMAGFHPDEEIELFEELLHEPSIICERIDKKLTFRSSQLEDGDIICYQITPEEQYRYPDVPSFFESIRIRQPVNAPRDEEAASTGSEEDDAASTESEEVEAHGVKLTVEGDVQGNKLTVEGGASIPQHEDPTKGGEATSTEGQTLVREALASDISVEATEAVAQESAQGDGGERSVEPLTTTPVLQGEQGLVTPFSSSAQPPAVTSMSSAGASTSHSIKSELPKRLVDLSIEQIRDIIVEADAAGRTNLSDQLIPLYTLVEDLHSSQREVPLTALAELQKAQEVAAQCRTEQEEIDKSLAVGELKVAALEATLTWAKGEVRELKRRRLALTPPAPQAIQTLRREAIKQEALNRLSRAKVEMLEVEYQKLLLSLE